MSLVILMHANVYIKNLKNINPLAIIHYFIFIFLKNKYLVYKMIIQSYITLVNIKWFFGQIIGNSISHLIFPKR